MIYKTPGSDTSLSLWHGNGQKEARQACDARGMGIKVVRWRVLLPDNEKKGTPVITKSLSEYICFQMFYFDTIIRLMSSARTKDRPLQAERKTSQQLAQIRKIAKCFRREALKRLCESPPLDLYFLKIWHEQNPIFNHFICSNMPSATGTNGTTYKSAACTCTYQAHFWQDQTYFKVKTYGMLTVVQIMFNLVTNLQM